MLAAFQGPNKEEEMVTLEDTDYFFFDCLESEHPPVFEDSATDDESW